jgi:hypothetical protein
MKKRRKTDKLDFCEIQSYILDDLSEIAPEGETFICMMEGPYRGLGWLLQEVETSQHLWDAGDAKNALITAWCAIVRLARERAILAAAASTMKVRIAEPVTLKEIKRCAEQKKNIIARQSNSQTKAAKCREKFAEFTPEEVKELGLNRVYNEVGELVQQSLELPAPIKGETVRKYISKK